MGDGTCGRVTCRPGSTSCVLGKCPGSQRYNGPSGRACCQQPTVTVRCPSGLSLLSAQINGLCRSCTCSSSSVSCNGGQRGPGGCGGDGPCSSARIGRGKGGYCQCPYCDTCTDEWWNSYAICGPEFKDWSGSMTCTYK